jgi:zinc transport system ATP-binding protein
MAWNADSSGALIKIRDIEFSYGSEKVLEEVSFDITSRDFLAVIGPNGLGKTTLVKIILGLLKPDKGHIEIFNKSINEFNQWNKIGYVPQKATHIDPLFPVSVKEVVGMGLLASKKFPQMITREEEDRIQGALDSVGMRAFSQRRIGNLSGGQQQRIFIARAIVNQPSVVFLDEPTTGVDVEMQEHFYDMLDELNKKQGITIVLITHEIGLLNRHVAKVACLNKKLVYHGEHAEFCGSAEFKEMLSNGKHLIIHKH